MLNKQELLNQVIEKLEAELEAHHRAAGSAFFEATDSENKAENKYDTRGLEASYLARGHALKLDELEGSIAQLKTFNLPKPSDGVQVGSLVSVRSNNYEFAYFLLPAGGGVELVVEGLEITVVTLSSPIGAQVVMKLKNQSLVMPNGKGSIITRII